MGFDALLMKLNMLCSDTFTRTMTCCFTIDQGGRCSFHLLPGTLFARPDQADSGPNRCPKLKGKVGMANAPQNVRVPRESERWRVSGKREKYQSEGFALFLREREC